MTNKAKPANNAAETKPESNSVILTHGQNAPRPNPASQVTWAPGNPRGALPSTNPYPPRPSSSRGSRHTGDPRNLPGTRGQVAWGHRLKARCPHITDYRAKV